jgi:hypothetical protein
MTYVSKRECSLTLGCLGDTLLAKCMSHALALSNLWLEKSGFLKARSHQLVNYIFFRFFFNIFIFILSPNRIAIDIIVFF